MAKWLSMGVMPLFTLPNQFAPIVGVLLRVDPSTELFEASLFFCLLDFIFSKSSSFCVSGRNSIMSFFFTRMGNHFKSVDLSEVDPRQGLVTIVDFNAFPMILVVSIIGFISLANKSPNMVIEEKMKNIETNNFTFM
ncbi:MAG: hypothetical protein ACKOXP_07160, partial [Flavobacteriales bacterium]